MPILNFLHSYIPSPLIATFGPIELHWYGFFYLLSFAIGYVTVSSALKKLQALGVRPAAVLYNRLPSFVTGLLLSGIAGARLYHVATQWSYYQSNIGEIPLLNHGGLAIHGGLFAGALYIFWFARTYLTENLTMRTAFLFVADLLAPVVLLGQAVGRWGNYFNQELFGVPTNLPWGIPIDLAHRPALYAAASYFHPVFFYEFLWDGIGALGLLYVLWIQIKTKGTKSLGQGYFFATYLIWVGVGRLLVELLRIDPTVTLLNLRLHSIVAMALVLVGVGFLAVAQLQKRTV